jgi:hypothetical protein
MKKKSTELIRIGWREWVALPDLKVPGVKAKVDTGARTSALHTADYECFEDEDGLWQVRFQLHPIKNRSDCVIEGQARVLTFREVKDSGGHVENRPFIETRVQLGNFEWPIELSLTNREQMKFRMLLGRTAIRRRFTVDAGRSYRLGKDLSHHYDFSAGNGNGE